MAGSKLNIAKAYTDIPRDSSIEKINEIFEIYDILMQF